MFRWLRSHFSRQRPRSEGQRGNSYATSPAGRASEIHDKRLEVRAYSNQPARRNAW
jgi:hypothetical protein